MVGAQVHLFVEGGGKGKDLPRRCREGFRKALERAGFAGHLPRIVASGSRSDTYDDFCKALADTTITPLLLVDSEEPLTLPPWSHLHQRDGWRQPGGATEDQALLMVTCMETWLVADRAALAGFFDHHLQVGALPPLVGLEYRACRDVQQRLADATRDCSTPYRKGDVSFRLLAVVNPAVLAKYLPNFERFITTLRAILL